MQRLVDSGRITPEEAAVHPRRSVLMRVLGDVDASPEIDTAIFDTKPGDRWMMCSDGLSSYVSDDKMASILATVRTAQGAADRLVKESLDHGAPDNVTVVLVDIDDSDGGSAHPADHRRLGRRARSASRTTPLGDRSGCRPCCCTRSRRRRPKTATSSPSPRTTSTN